MAREIRNTPINIHCKAPENPKINGGYEKVTPRNNFYCVIPFACQENPSEKLTRYPPKSS